MEPSSVERGEILYICSFVCLLIRTYVFLAVLLTAGPSDTSGMPLTPPLEGPKTPMAGPQSPVKWGEIPCVLLFVPLAGPQTLLGGSQSP